MPRPVVLSSRFWRDPRLRRYPDRARMLYLALRQHADDRGRVSASVGQVADFAFPRLQREEDLARLRADVERMIVDRVLRYGTRADGSPCLRFTTWDLHFREATPGKRRRTRGRG